MLAVMWARTSMGIQWHPLPSVGDAESGLMLRHHECQNLGSSIVFDCLYWKLEAAGILG